MKGAIGLNTCGESFVFIENLIACKSKESISYTVHPAIDSGSIYQTKCKFVNELLLAVLLKSWL